jgi:hypothetical protein
METKSIFDNEFTTDDLLIIKEALNIVKDLNSKNERYITLLQKVEEKMTTVVYLKLLTPDFVYWTTDNNGDTLVNYQNGLRTLHETIDWLKGTIFTGQPVTFKLFENGTLRNLK